MSNTQKDNLTITSFGFTPEGRESFAYTLQNKNQVKVTIIDFGATINAIKIPLEKNEFVDVVLGFDSVTDYMNSFKIPGAPFMGAVVGRYAGRIKNGTFTLNNEIYQLNKNLDKNHLHGGISNFSNNFWNVISLSEQSITLEYISKDLEENFPGELTVQVTYTLTEENELEITYSANTTKDTIINLTQHSYFNLDGHKNSIENQELLVATNKLIDTDENNVPTGYFLNVSNLPFDFTSFKKCPEKIDNSFVIQDNSKAVATLKSTKNKLQMKVYTNQPSVHIYVGGNCSNLIKGKSDSEYHSFSGICFETQNFPDAPNHSHFPNAFLKKEETYYQKTSFTFEKI